MLKLLERWFVVLMLLFLSDGIVWIIIGDNESNFVRPGGNTALHVFQVFLYFVAILFTARHWKAFASGLVAGRWVLALSLFAIASVMWSQDPNGTALHSLALLATTSFGVYFGARYTWREQLGLLARTFAVIMALSVVFAIFLPRYGIDHFLHWGAWQGIFAQKNLLGKAMLVSVIVFLSAGKLMSRYVRWCGIGASVLLIGLSQSKTSLVLIPIFLILGPLYGLVRAKWPTRIPIGLMIGTTLAGLAAAAFLNAQWVLTAMGRDLTLTGRIGLWKAVIDRIWTHFVLGYGFDAFWMGIRGESANVILALGWAAKHSHNGFLDLLLDLGFVGFSLFAISYFIAFRGALRLVATGNGAGIWPMHYLAFTVLYYLTEGQMLRQDSLYWALYVATVVSVCLRTQLAEVSESEEAEDSSALENSYTRGPSGLAPAAVPSWGGTHA